VCEWVLRTKRQRNGVGKLGKWHLKIFGEVGFKALEKMTAYLPSFGRLRRRLICTLFRRFLTFRRFSSQVGWIFRRFGYLVLSTDNTGAFTDCCVKQFELRIHMITFLRYLLRLQGTFYIVKYILIYAPECIHLLYYLNGAVQSTCESEIYQHWSNVISVEKINSYYRLSLKNLTRIIKHNFTLQWVQSAVTVKTEILERA